MLLATAAVGDMELRHIDVEQAFLKAPINQGVDVAIPDVYQEFPEAVGLLKNALYDTVQAGRCWNN